MKILPFATFGLAASNFFRMRSLSKDIALNSSDVDSVMEKVNSLDVRNRLEYIEELLGSNITELITNLESLDLALDQVDVLNIILELQNAKIEATKAIEMAESAFNFFNAPVDLTNYITISNGEVTYKSDYVKSSGYHFVFAADNSGISKLSPHATLLGSVTGEGSRGVKPSDVVKSNPAINSYSGTAKTIEKGIQPMSFGSQGYLIIPGNEDVASKRLILQFKNNQAPQALNAFEIMKSINDGRYYETGFTLMSTFRWMNTFGSVYKSVPSSVVVRPGSSKDFTVRLLTDNIAEVTLHPTVRATFAKSNSLTEYVRWSEGDSSYQGNATLSSSVSSGPTVTALLIPLSLCEISNITYYEEGVPASNSENDVLIT